MKTATRERLLREGDEYLVIREESISDDQFIIWMDTPKGMALIHEYDGDHGFEVYMITPNRIHETRHAMGFDGG